MKKISLKLHRDIITALATVARMHHNYKTGDRLFDSWFADSITELLLKFAKLRNRSSQFFTVSFKLEELILIRELTDLHKQLYPTSYESIVLQEYIINPVLALV